MEIEGTIVLNLGRQSGIAKSSGKEWKKDEYVLETVGTYPRKVKFHIFGDRCDTIQLEIGKSYVLSCDVESREFNGRWYTDVNVFAARPMDATVAQPMQQQPAAQGYAAPQTQAPAAPFGTQAAGAFAAPAEDSSDDLPF